MQLLEILSFFWQFGLPGVMIAIVLYAAYRLIYKWPETKSGVLKFGAALRIKRCIRSASGAAVEAHVYRKLNSLRLEESEFIPEIGQIRLRRHVLDEDWEEDGKVIIVLEEHRKIEQNLLNFCEVFVEKYFLRESRPYLHPDVNVVTNAALIRRLLEGNSAALSLWNESHFEDKVKQAGDCMSLWDEMVIVDANGLLTRFLVPEYQLFSIRAAGSAPTSSIIRESKELVHFIAGIAGREKGDPPAPLTYPGDHYGVSVTIIGHYYKLLDRRVRAHTKWVLRHLENPRISDVYILAGGNEACYACMSVVDQTYSSSFIERIRYHAFESRWRARERYPVVLIHYVKGICIDPESKELTAKGIREDLSARFKGTALFVSHGSVSKWFKTTGEQYVDKRHWKHMDDRVLKRVARLMSRYRMFRDDLPSIYTNDAINDSIERILTHSGMNHLHFYPETFLRVQLYNGTPTEEWIDQLAAEVSLTGYEIEIPPDFKIPEIEMEESNSNDAD